MNPIKGLQPKYTEEDFEKFTSWKDKKAEQKLGDEHKVQRMVVKNG